MADGQPREPGWYRLGDHGWEPVDANDAAEEIQAGGGHDLMYYDAAVTGAEVPLF
jgi:hypothetical protein